MSNRDRRPDSRGKARATAMEIVAMLLPNLVVSAQTLARVPISNFHIRAVGVGPSSRIFFRVNLELPGLPLHHFVHAEQFLVTNRFINGETNLDCLAVSAAPCGYCCQFLQEIHGAPDVKIPITSDKEQDFTPLSQFLSH
ncbi:hypothetical protein K1719_027655 [Acacia pycnantha]|nr:hypothetical protein K1719_027655 [Acacia pycnantha]